MLIMINLQLFLTFYRIVPGDRNLNNAKFRLIDYFKWKKIGTVKQNDDTRYALVSVLLFKFLFVITQNYRCQG